MGNRPEIRLPPLAQAALGKLSVRGRLGLPEHGVLERFPFVAGFLELSDGIFRSSCLIPELHHIVVSFIITAGILILPVSFPGQRLREKFLISFLFFFREPIKPWGPSADIIFSVAHSPSDGIPFDLRIGDPWGRHDLFFF
jgi:hypothetical protein